MDSANPLVVSSSVEAKINTDLYVGFAHAFDGRESQASYCKELQRSHSPDSSGSSSSITASGAIHCINMADTPTSAPITNNNGSPFFHCHLCTKAYSSEKSLNKHVRKKHLNDCSRRLDLSMDSKSAVNIPQQPMSAPEDSEEDAAGHSADDSIVCPECSTTIKSKKAVAKHFMVFHSNLYTAWKRKLFGPCRLMDLTAEMVKEYYEYGASSIVSNNSTPVTTDLPDAISDEEFVDDDDVIDVKPTDIAIAPYYEEHVEQNVEEVLEEEDQSKEVLSVSQPHFECRHCHRNFNREAALERHELSCTNEPPDLSEEDMICPFCNNVTNKRGLGKHVQFQHTEEYRFWKGGGFGSILLKDVDLSCYDVTALRESHWALPVKDNGSMTSVDGQTLNNNEDPLDINCPFCITYKTTIKGLAKHCINHHKSQYESWKAGEWGSVKLRYVHLEKLRQLKLLEDGTIEDYYDDDFEDDQSLNDGDEESSLVIVQEEPSKPVITATASASVAPPPVMKPATGPRNEVKAPVPCPFCGKLVRGQGMGGHCLSHHPEEYGEWKSGKYGNVPLCNINNPPVSKRPTKTTAVSTAFTPSFVEDSPDEDELPNPNNQLASGISVEELEDGKKATPCPFCGELIFSKGMGKHCIYFHHDQYQEWKAGKFGNMPLRFVPSQLEEVESVEQMTERALKRREARRKNGSLISVGGDESPTSSIGYSMVPSATGALTMRIKPIDKTGVFPCGECGKVFDRSASLSQHLRIHKFGPSMSRHGGQSTQSVTLSSDNIVIKNEVDEFDDGDVDEMFRCNDCDGYFATIEDLDHHVVAKHSHQQSEDGPSNNSFILNYSLLNNNNSTDSSKKADGSGGVTETFVCDVCHTPYPSKRSLSQHMRIHKFDRSSNGSLLYIPDCENSPNKLNMSSGSQMTPPISINNSDFIDTAASGLVNDEFAKFTCKVCYSVFPSARSLAQHNRIHKFGSRAAGARLVDDFQDLSQVPMHSAMPRRPMDEDFDGDLSISLHAQQEIDDWNEDCLPSSFTETVATPTSNIKMVSCPRCFKTFKTKWYLKEHLNRCYSKASEEELESSESTLNLLRDSLPGSSESYKCANCPKNFKNMGSLQNHERHCIPKNGEDPTGAYPCRFCTLRFKRQHLANTHMLTCSKRDPNAPVIEEGEKEMSHMEYEAQKIINENMEEVYKCRFCDRTFRSSSHIRNHEKFCGTNIVNREVYHCDLCQKRFFLKCHLAVHMKIHKREMMLSDLSEPSSVPMHDLVSHPLQQQQQQEQHIQQHKKQQQQQHTFHLHKQLPPIQPAAAAPKPVQQPRPQQPVLQNQQQQASPISDSQTNGSAIGIYQCDKCDRMFNTQCNLQKHQVAHSESSVPCRTCNREFKMACHLARHLCTGATNQLPDSLLEGCGMAESVTADIGKAGAYECKFCSKTFQYAGNLTVHMKFCKKASSGFNSQESQEDVAMILDDDDDIHECNLCNEVFHSKIELVEHTTICEQQVQQIDVSEILDTQQQQLGEDGSASFGTFKCKHCLMLFTTRSNLYSHMRVHGYAAERLRVTCPDCGKSYCRKDVLDAHMRTSCRGAAAHVKDEDEPSVKKMKLEDKSVLENILSKIKSEPTKSSGTFPCDICHSQFQSHNGLMVHRAKCHFPPKSMRLDCEGCRRSLPSQSQLTKHQLNCPAYLSMKSQGKLSQSQGKTSNAAMNLIQAKPADAAAKSGKGMLSLPNRCPHCPRAFLTAVRLSEHIASVHLNANTPTAAATSNDAQTMVTKPTQLSALLKIGVSLDTSLTSKELEMSQDEFDEEEDEHMYPGADAYLCSMCDRSFSNFERLNQHLQVAHDIASLPEVNNATAPVPLPPPSGAKKRKSTPVVSSSAASAAAICI